MKAVRLIQTGKPLELQHIDIPKVGPQDVLVKVKAAGICHSDAHYRAGTSPAFPLPLTLGHEVAGIVEQIGNEVTHIKNGDRVCIHYLVTCGHCYYCNQGNEQFCTSGAMIGKHLDGGYAEYIRVPARSAFPLPDVTPFEQGAVLMCSSTTSFHALNKARLKPGETVAIFGAGGLGIPAIQLSHVMGASRVYAVDINPNKLEMAEQLGAIPINANQVDPVTEIHQMTDGKGVDVSLELIGLADTMRQAVKALAIFGRAAIAGLMDRSFEIYPYEELINKEVEIIGVSDHLAQELPRLMSWVESGKLNLSDMITHSIPLEAEAINVSLDNLEGYGEDVRVVILP